MASPRHVVISVPSGDATDAMIDQLASILEPGDVDHRCRQQPLPRLEATRRELAEKGIEWLDMGVSGGIWGLEVGFCAMLGGKREVFERFEPVVQTLAPEGGLPVLRRQAGAGHYVKMVHNGIEYGIMQAYGEGFDILHASDYELDLAAIAGCGTTGRSSAPGCSSWRRAPSRGRAMTSSRSPAGSPTRARAAGPSPRRSTMTCPAPVITLSLLERFRSRRAPDSYTDRVLAALRNEFGGHAIKARE